MDKKTIDSKLKKDFSLIVGKENYFDSELDKLTYSYDGSFEPLLPAHKPEIILRAQNTVQVAAIMKLANQHGIAVVPRGAASNRSGGTVPLAGGIVLDLEAMNQILEFDDSNLTVTVEPGVRTYDLYNYCAERGLFFPPDPASWKFSTIGGNIAENAGGTRAVKYGVTGDYVMGLEIVLADGRVINTGGKSIKNVTGYNLTSLMVGSEGTLGVVTKAILKLIPMPKHRETIQVMFGSLDDACLMVKETILSGTIPAAAEIMDQTCIQAVAKFRKMDIDPLIEACITFELDGDNQIALREQSTAMEEIAKKNGAREFRIAPTKEAAEELWSIRRGLGPAVATMAPNKIGEDISVPRSRLPEIVRKVRDIAAKYDLKIAVFGHAGDGNVHPSILTDMSIASEMKKVEEAVEEIFSAAIDLGGTLSGEHGIGISKKPYIYNALGDVGVEVHRQVKQALDPKGILNPGKIF